MNNEDVIQQIIDIVCNRFEDMIKSMVSANLENGITVTILTSKKIERGLIPCRLKI